MNAMKLVSGPTALRFVLPVLLSLLVLLVSSSSSKAIPLSTYHKHLEYAITTLDTLNQLDEEETGKDFEKRLGDTLNGVRDMLPANQSVQLEQEIWNVDNTWLHIALNDIERADDSKRRLLIRHTIERLQSVTERVKEMENPGKPGLSKAEANERLAGILRRAEYEHQLQGRAAWERAIDDFIRWLKSWLPKPATPKPGQGAFFVNLAQVLVWILALAVIGFVVLKLLPKLKGLRRSRKKIKPQARIVLGEQLAPDQSAGDLLSDADALAGTGDLRAAIRKAYIALLVELGDRRIISLAQHKTNRDYLRSVSNLPSLYPGMSTLTESFERHWYGLAQATPSDWQDFRAGYKAALQART
ncbi:MAG TPA: DUF4129 domain-containing protein [Pyrinomonadaceae bacterium]|nr:DUF4129 domain-containing protein [Pyrinomonadaceae bacterium]